MSNCFLLWKNRLKDASLSGGSWQLGLDNLKSEGLSLVCRSNDLSLSNTQFSLTYPQTIYNRAIALINHNLSTTAQIRITATRDSGAFTAYDSGWIDVYPSVYDSYDLAWEDENFWYGRPTSDMLSGYTRNFLHLFPGNVTADVWTVELDDQVNNTDGFIDIGYVFLSNAWQPARNFNFNNSLGFINRTREDITLGGSSRYDKQRSARKWEIDIHHMSQGEAYSQIVDMISGRGISDPVIFVPEPDNERERFRQVFLSSLKDTSGIVQTGYNLYSTHLVFKELLP